MTRHAYDPHTFAWPGCAASATPADGVTYQPTGAALQDVGYGYDLAGNILTIRDRTPGSGIPNNPDALPAATRRWRGCSARRRPRPPVRLRPALPPAHGDRPGVRPTGRARRGTTSRAAPTSHAPRAYTERYEYDAARQPARLGPRSAGGFTRTFDLTPAPTACGACRSATTAYDYTFDANGNLRPRPRPAFEWDHANQLTAFRTQTGGAEPSVHAQYLYDAAGRRVKKLVRHQGGQIEVTHYVERPLRAPPLGTT